MIVTFVLVARWKGDVLFGERGRYGKECLTIGTMNEKCAVTLLSGKKSTEICFEGGKVDRILEGDNYSSS